MPLPQANASVYNGYFWVAGYAIAIGILILISKTKPGYTFLKFFFIVSAIVVSLTYVSSILQIFQTVAPSSPPVSLQGNPNSKQ